MFESLYNFVIDLLSSYPYFFIFFFMFVESSFVPFPSEIVMIPAWWFAAQGKINLILAILCGLFGSIAGALFNYYLAKIGWIKLSKKLIWEKYHNLWVEFFRKYGDITTFSGRLIPLLRQYISFPAGLFEMDIKKFVLYTWLGAWIWVIFLALVGYYIGINWEKIKEYKYIFLILTLVLIIFLIWLKIWLLRKFKN